MMHTLYRLALLFNDGFGKALPGGSRLRFQIHYTPNGTATTDQPEIGMIFLNEKPDHLVDVVGVSARRLAIPPHDPNFEVVASQAVPKQATILAFFPHMHLRGKAFRYEVTLPDGQTHTLLDIPRYDFNWQLSYRLANPVTLPAGATIRAVAHFDNSSDNPANPDPNRTVRWGSQTEDEMMIGYIEMSPSGPANGDTNKAFGSVKIPWLLMTGTKDDNPVNGADPKTRLVVFPALSPGSKYQLVLDKAAHSAFTERALPGDAGQRNPNHHRAMLALTAAFWDAHVRNDATARAWLDGDEVKKLLESADVWQKK